MNERIKELISEAGFGLGSFGFDSDPEMACGSVKDLEKFAELIVKECATAIINDRRLNDVRSAANGCVRTIKEHFGVEE